MDFKNALGYKRSVLRTGALVVLLAAHLAVGAERGGLLVDVQKKIMKRNDRNTVDGTGTVERTLSLKVDIKNNSMRDMPETKADYVVLVQRWGIETGNLERFEGTAKIETLALAHSQSVNLGEFRIGGHYHGTSEIHVDRLAAWKVSIERDGKKLDFTSSPNFDALNKRAMKGSP